MTTLKAFYVDDMPTIYAASTIEDAARLYEHDLGEPCEDGYPREASEAELDKPVPDYDDNEQPTGEMTSMRVWLEGATPGLPVRGRVMRHLALPFYCAVAVGLLLALLAWALRNQVDAVALACAIGAVFFAWRCWEDLQTTWPAFKAEMQRRSDERQRAPLAADDTH